MPKRVPTPPPGDDEPRYLTVVHPYAISGTCNMELPKDRQDFARWVACCIDKDAFFAIFHKPSSRGMVIIEIKRDYPHFDRILGEHRWSEFLQNPTKEEMDQATKVFYCTYSTGRQVQKNGWKRIDVDEAWFKGWTPRNRHIESPYPSTHFCDVPVEDHTNHPLCRPLPGAVKTPPVEVIAAPQPVVGSAEWIQKKATRPSSPPGAKNPLGAWGKGAPHLRATSAKPNPTANGSVKKTNFSQAPHAVTRRPAVGGGPIAVKASNVWQNKGKKPPVVESWDSSPPVSRGSTPLSRAVSPTTSHQAPSAPPGLPRPKNGWEDDVTHPLALAVPGRAGSIVQSDPDRAGSVSAASWSSTGASQASPSTPDSDSGPDLTPTTESDNPYAVHIHFSESMEEEFHGMSIRAIDDEDDLGGLDFMAPQAAWDEPLGNAAWENAPGGWDDGPLDAEDQWRQTLEPAPTPMLCNAHGIICKKGICAEYAKQLRLQKRAEEAEQRKTAAANKGKKNFRGKGRGAGKNDENENQLPGRNTMQNNPFRGPGAPVKTNWRARAIVSADTIEKRESTKADSDDGWGNSDSEAKPNAAAVVSTGVADAASDASWGMSEGAFDPWAEPGAKANQSQAGGKPQTKKPASTKVSSSWADQVEAEVNGGGGNNFTTVASKRGSKRGKGSSTSWGTRSTNPSAAGWGTSTTDAAKSSTSGWGSVAEMPW